MERGTLLRLGGYSSLHIFHRGLGSNDEAAGLSERSDRILYGFPHEVSPAEQMRRVAYFEGLIDFSSTFAPSGGNVQSITLKKRRYAFCQVEKQIWMVVGIVREQIRDVNSEGGGGGGGGASNASVFISDNVADAALRGLMQRFWDSFCLFYGSVGRVLETPAASKMLAHISDLKRRLRKVHNRRVALAANYEFARGEHLAATSDVYTAALSPGEEYRDGDIRRGENSTMTAETASTSRKALAALSAEEHVGGILLSCVERFSPISVLRRLIRSVMDFLIYYTDWSNLCAPFEGYGAVRSHNLSRRDQPPAELSSYVKEFVAKLQRGEPSVQHVALAFDGILVAGQSHPSVPILFQYLRMHVFHAAHLASSKKTTKADTGAGGGSATQATVTLFEPDLRDYELSSLEVSNNLERKISSPKVTASVGSSGGVGRSLLKQTSVDSISSPSEKASSTASNSGVVHFIDGQLWSDAVDLKALLLDLTERLCSDPVSLSSVVRIIPPNEIDITTGLPKWPLLVRCALRDAMQGSSIPRGIPISPSSLSLLVNASVASPQQQESVNSPGSEKGGGPMSPTASVATSDFSGSPIASTATAPARASVNSMRGGASNQRLPLHSSGNKPASLSVPALPAAANAMHCLRGAVTVDLSWPVLHLPYTSQRFLESLSPLVDISSFPDSNNSTDTTRNPDDDDTDTIRTAFQTAREINLKFTASSGCFGPEVAPPSLVSTAVAAAAANSNTSSSSAAATSISGLFRAAMGRPLVAEAAKPATSSNSNHVLVPVDPPRVFMPALFESADKPPSHRLLWIQQGLVSVMTFIDANALSEKNPQFKRPLDLDCATALSLAKLLTNVSDVFLKLKRSHSSPPIDEGLGMSLDSRALKTAQEGLEGSRSYGMRLVKPEVIVADERTYDSSEGREVTEKVTEAVTASTTLSLPYRTLDVHGTRVSARRPSKSSTASASTSISTTLVTQASPVSSLEAAADDLGPHLLRSAIVSLQLASGAAADGTDDSLTHFGSHISPHSGRHLVRQLIIANGLPDPIVHIRNPVNLPRLEQPSPWPVSEMHMLATATQGMAASRRTGQCYSIQAYDGPESTTSSNNNLSSLTTRRLEGTSESDLHAMLTSVKAAERVMFTV